METNLKGKTVLVTEVVNPLGKSIALAFAREGANLVLGTENDSDALRATAQEALTLGTRLVVKNYHPESGDSVTDFVQSGLAEFGRIDILVNNMAWSAAKKSFAATSFESWQRSIHLGLTQSVLLCRAVLPKMIEQRWGRLIQCLGMEGFVGGDPANSTVQAGLIGLTRGMSTHYGKDRITANCVAYGGVEGLDNFPGAYPISRLNDPLERIGSEHEISSAIIYLASENAGYITGQCYLVNGGKCFL
jgi:NAD(P)-dependent dehydrogenase (short-subunit alcohol dehydrogenase family)